MKTFISVFTVFLLSVTSFAQNLRINDPQTWRSGQGTIEETKISYEPKGLFMKVDWELTFSARGINDFSESDTVEIVYNFNLPQGAIITGSWLWFNDSILKAKIMDRWSANQIYENIVNRRRDPSVLYKNWGNNYDLRVFPMAAKESRRVKITFLTPADWTQKTVSSHFLSENLLASKNSINNIEVTGIIGTEWGTPIITGETETVLEPVSGEDYSNAAQINFEDLQADQKFVVRSPLNNGYYLNFFEEGDEQFYQLAMNPLENVGMKEPEKVLFLVDFQKENTFLSQSEVLHLLSSNLIELLSEKDSFNILYYNLELQQAGENWIAGDSASIVEAIGKLGDDPFVSYSNLPSLLASGIELSQQGNCKIILLANSDKLGDTGAANELISDLMKKMNPAIPIYIGDFQTRNYYYSYIRNVNYRGNEYLYRNLAKLTGGDYYNLFEGGTFSDCVRNIYKLATSKTGLIDIHTTLENGFCYGRFSNMSQSGNINSDIYLETGRYSGEFPFEIKVAGLYGDELFSKKLSLLKDEIQEADSLIGIWWYGKEILDMENSPNSYSIINDIIDKSIEKRILCNYTAFLCLEPGMEIDIDENEVENRWVSGEFIDDVVISAPVAESAEFEVNAYPNPFTSRVNIKIRLPAGASVSNTEAEIYDLFGKRIKVFNLQSFNGDSEIEIQWDASDENGSGVSKGTYIFICNTPKGRISKKLVVM